MCVLLFVRFYHIVLKNRLLSVYICSKVYIQGDCGSELFCFHALLLWLLCFCVVVCVSLNPT